MDLSTWRLNVTGHLDKPLELSFDDLQSKFPARQHRGGESMLREWSRLLLAAVIRRAMGEWGYGQCRMDRRAASRHSFGRGCEAGRRGGQLQDGLDQPAMPTVPDFVKSLTTSRIMDDPDVLVAYQMNGQPLPMLNGYPARLIVPGWYATYWVKHLSEITVLDREFEGFWMRKAYLIPDTPCGCVEPGTAPVHTVPINRLDVRSLIVAPSGDERLTAGKAIALKGIAFDSGYGIQEVLVSTDNGASWRPAQLGKDLGNYSFREWSFQWVPARRGHYSLMVCATNRIGESQPSEALWNPAGYLRNVVERVDVMVA